MGSIDDFKHRLETYGLQANFDHLLQAIRSSFLTAGQLAIELPERDAQILRQLGVGWTALTDEGRRIGRELVDSAISADSGLVENALKSVPLKVVALFYEAAQRGMDVYSLRVPVETRGFDQLLYASSLRQFMEHERVHPNIIALTNQLVQKGLAKKYVAPAYRSAKWDATFIYFPAAVAELMMRFLVDHSATLEDADRLLNHYSLLKNSPVPSLRELDVAGISENTLSGYLGNALDLHIVTTVVEEGPAFLVLDPKSYAQVVLRPSFERIVDELLSQAKELGGKEMPPSEGDEIIPTDDAERREVTIPERQDQPTSSSGLNVLLGTVGTEKVVWTPARENNWNFAIVGSAGTGKTQTVKGVLRELAREGVPYIIFDFMNGYVPPKSSTSDYGDVIDLDKLSVNPLGIDGSNSPRDQKYQISDIIDLVYSIGELQVAHIREAIRLSYLDKGINEDDPYTWQQSPPTFKDFQRNLEQMAEEGDRAQAGSIKGIFARLDPLFDYEIFSASTVVPFEQLIKGQRVVNLGALANDNLKAVVCEFLLRKFRYYFYTLPDSRDPQLFIVIDEAHRLKYEREASAGQLLKESRSKGVGLILSTQDPVDFTEIVYNNIGGILSLCLTEPTYARRISQHLGGRVTWQDVKNGLSGKFSAFVKFSSRPDAIRFRVTPDFERLV